jgi:uncharacterized membrane protein
VNPLTLTAITTGTNVTIVAGTIVQLATLGVIAYAVYSLRAIVVHWLDKRIDPLVTRRNAVQAAIDEIRKNGIDSVQALATT